MMKSEYRRTRITCRAIKGKDMEYKEIRCPFNKFKPCLLEQGKMCGFAIKAGEAHVCSIPFIAHELFVIADKQEND